MRKIIIDTDPGIDDAAAIAIANAFLFILFSYRISAVSISAQHFAE